MLSSAKAEKLKPLLDPLLSREALAARVPHDPVRFPRRYQDPADVEVAALVSACFAYGKAEVFLERLEGLFQRLGPHPSLQARRLARGHDAGLLDGFGYRFQVAGDAEALVAAVGAVQERWGLVRVLVEQAFADTGAVRGAMAALVAALRGAASRTSAGLDHLLARPEGVSPAKRWMLLARWMVRGGPDDPVDLGVWRGVTPSALVVPLDVHIARIARQLGLTRRTDLSRRTAEEITASLRRLDPSDPVRYDFALCHLGMSRRCATRCQHGRDPTCDLAALCRPVFAR